MILGADVRNCDYVQWKRSCAGKFHFLFANLQEQVAAVLVMFPVRAMHTCKTHRIRHYLVNSAV